MLEQFSVFTDFPNMGDMGDFDENDIVDFTDDDSSYTFNTSEDEEDEERLRELDINGNCRLEQAVYDLQYKLQSKTITNLDVEVKKACLS